MPSSAVNLPRRPQNRSLSSVTLFHERRVLRLASFTTDFLFFPLPPLNFFFFRITALLRRAPSLHSPPHRHPFLCPFQLSKTSSVSPASLPEHVHRTTCPYPISFPLLIPFIEFFQSLRSLFLPRRGNPLMAPPHDLFPPPLFPSPAPTQDREKRFFPRPQKGFLHTPLSANFWNLCVFLSTPSANHPTNMVPGFSVVLFCMCTMAWETPLQNRTLPK